MSPEQAKKLRERQEGFDEFFQALMPGLVEFVEAVGITPAHMVLKQAEQYVPYMEDATKDFEVKSEEDRTYFLIRMAWFIGEVFVQKFQGCWFVDDLPQSRYFASYVAGKFKPPINAMLRIDPFGIAADYVDGARPRKLVALLKDVEEGVRAQPREDFLIPVERLTVSQQLLQRLNRKSEAFSAVERNRRALEAYARYCLLQDSRLRAEFGLGDVPKLQAFYNAYYWFLRAVMLTWEEGGDYKKVHDLAFSLLVQAPDDADGSLIAKIFKDLRDEFDFVEDEDDDDDEDDEED